MPNTGEVKTLKMVIDSPMKMDSMVIHNKRLNILIGNNGSGKTLILKTNWAMSMSMCAAFMPVQGDLITGAQYIFDHTFEEQNFNGFVFSEWDRGSLELRFDRGKVTEATVDKGGADTPTPAIFMSTTMRLFSQVKQYLQLQKALGDEALLEYYKLYDVVYMALLKTKLANGWEVPKEIQAMMEKSMSFRYKLGTITMDDVSVYNTAPDGTKTDLAHLSNGEQAMLNMMMGAHFG